MFDRNFSETRKCTGAVTSRTIILLVLALVLAACGNNGSTDDDEGATQDEDEGAVDAEDGEDSVETVTLSAVSYGGESYPIRVLIEDIIRELESRSDGMIEFDYHPGESLVRLADGFQSARDQTVDIALTSAAYEPDRMGVLAAVANLPFNWELEAFGEQYREPGHFYDFAAPYFEENGLKLISWPNVPAGEIISRDPIITPDDFQGKLVRGVSSLHPGLRLMGAEPVDIPTADLYSALQRGTVDAAALAIPSMVSDGYYEVAPHITLTNFYTGSLPIVMNLDRYESLPDEVRELFDEVVLEQEAAYYERVPREGEEDIEFLKEQEGVEVYELGPEEVQEWRDAVSPAEEELAEEFGEEWDRFLELRETMLR
jgi:TRAP-type transport system periplasmic protein